MTFLETASPANPVLPMGADLKVYINFVVDTGVIIDTWECGPGALRAYAERTLETLRELAPDVSWSQEDVSVIHGSDDALDFFPSVNLSFVQARSDSLRSGGPLVIGLTGDAACTVTFAEPVVYFHTFSSGLLSLRAQLSWSQPCTIELLQELNDRLIMGLAPLMEEPLLAILKTFKEGVRRASVPVYSMPVAAFGPATVSRDLFYWSHFVYVATSHDEALIPATAAWLERLMMPIDQSPFDNQALKPNRFIYLGWGRSMICCHDSMTEGSLFAYVRTLEIRNYLWKVLYDLDRGLRSAMATVGQAGSERKALRLSLRLRDLDVRVQSFLEELDPYKMTFDHEKVWLIRQLDQHWFTPDLVRNVRNRLSAFAGFYEYSEATARRQQEERVAFVLNLVALLAGTGTVVQVFGFIGGDMSLQQRIDLLVGTVVAVVGLFVLTMVLARVWGRNRL